MGPKKKKKVPGNPARGFSTVSVPSKPKQDVSSDSEAPAAGPDDIAPFSISETAKLNNDREQSDIRDMLPQELETYLEAAELEGLLKSNSTRCKLEATRQITKLKTETRQLRSQSVQLSTFNWLDDRTVEQILSISGQDLIAPPATTSLLQHGDHKLLLDLWILQQVLSSLGFPEPNEALAHLLQLAFTYKIRSDGGYIWGLSETWDWYALNFPSKELPEYQTFTVPQPTVVQDLPLTQSNYRPEVTNSQLPLGNPTKPTTEAIRADEVADISDSSEDSGQDDDNDPVYLIERYVQLRTDVWRTDHPEIDVDKSRAPHPKKAQKRRSRLANIEKDILFDQDEAHRIWEPVHLRLEAEESIKKRIAEKTHRRATTTNDLRKAGHTSKEQPDSSEPGCSQDVSEAEEQADVFGSLFASADDQLGVQPRPLATAVRIEDFGTLTGMPSRQVLEQTCLGFDPGFKLQVKVLEQTTYSARHRIELSWSSPRKEDRLAVEAVVLKGFAPTFRPSHWTLDMQTVAARTTEQSISYAAAVMLFLVVSTDGQETQVSLRLAGVWRNELIELSDKRNEFIRDRDKRTLLELRRLVDNEIASFKASDIKGADSDQGLGAYSQLPIHQRQTVLQAFDSQRAYREWVSRASSPTFRKMLGIRQQLPIYHHKDKILETIFSNPISIVSAETGSGKSTQCGSYILERELSFGRDCRILITQPRRISAISLARRVSQEWGEPPNAVGTPQSLIGYSIRMESKVSANTRLTFATTGVLLRMLESSPTLEQLDCLILDEVHERTLDTDLLFIILRELLKKRSSLKLVLMSATVNAKMFSEYFGGAPVLDIPGRTFPVEVGFLEDALEATNDISDKDLASSPEPEEPAGEDDDEQPVKERALDTPDLKGYSSKTRKRLAKMDEYRIDYVLVVKLAAAIATKPEYAKFNSAILIFMPGIAEIRRLHRALLSTDLFSDGWQLHLLHSSFSTEELERAFSIPPKGEKKIVIATNIAETGITIPDVTAVIDTCKEKIMRYNERRQLSKLTEGFISRSSAKQRKGRAARVQDGICFHLVTKHYHDNFLQEESMPEILRLSLQDPILRIKIWNFGSAEETLANAITPPSRKNIVRAVDKLREAGALTGSEQLTSLGEQVARLPLDVTLAKFAVLGAVFQCLDPVLTIVSIMTSKSPFIGGFDAKSYFSRSDSDLLSVLNAYEGWRIANEKGSAIQYCQKNFLSHQTLMQIEEQKIQLTVYLVDGGQMQLTHNERLQLNKARTIQHHRQEFYQIPHRYNKKVNDHVLLSLISMAFYPRVLIKEGKGFRNVYTNQRVSLARGSVNAGGTRPPQWLSFLEAMQTRPGNLNVFETSRIPEAALALLLGEADVRLFPGVVSIDSGKIRLAVGNWKQALAIKRLRKALLNLLDRSHRRPGEPVSDKDQQWLDLFVSMMAEKEVPIT